MKQVFSVLLATAFLCTVPIAGAGAMQNMHMNKKMMIKAHLHNGNNVVSSNGHKFNVIVKNKKIVSVTAAGGPHGMMAANGMKLKSSTHTGDMCTDCYIDDYGNIVCFTYAC